MTNVLKEANSEARTAFVGALKSAYFPFGKENVLPSLVSEISPPETQKVYLRIKPFHKTEATEFVVEEDEITITQPSLDQASGSENAVNHKYKFTRIFGPGSTQKELFRGICMDPLKSFLGGDDYLLFAYGATNAGKTYTIQGKPDGPGLIPQALNMVFSTLKGKIYCDCRFRPCKINCVEELDAAAQLMQHEMKDKILNFPLDTGERAANFCSTPNFKRLKEPKAFSSPSFQEMKSSLDELVAKLDADRGGIGYYVWVSFFEIHNEQIYDLLDAPPTARDGRRKTLSLVTTDSGSFVKDLRYVSAISADEAYHVYMYGKHNLQVAATNCNAVSSRSHSVFSIKLVFHASNGDRLMPRVSAFSCVDLAGSERSKKTHNAGDRLRESQHINTSLLVLGRCLEAIRHNQKSRDRKMVPYRDSKLTRVFQHSLMALPSVAIIVNVNLETSMTKETMNALKFSAIAREIVILPPHSEIQYPATLQLEEHEFDCKCEQKQEQCLGTKYVNSQLQSRVTPNSENLWRFDIHEIHLQQIHRFYQRKISKLELEHKRKCEVLLKHDNNKRIECSKLEHELAATKKRLDESACIKENAQLKLKLAMVNAKLKETGTDDVAQLELQLAVLNKKLKTAEDVLFRSNDTHGKEKLLTLVEVLQTQLGEALVELETEKVTNRRLTELLVEVARNDCILLENDEFDLETMNLNVEDGEITCELSNESVEILEEITG